ncbi:IucA/IucC family protein [Metabacillus sp. 113a]|uniref:IucA/IucC family protein n=1 Tax=Metabacillus sp. 113a TaxID=3404706 RepID=UPI003CF2CA29
MEKVLHRDAWEKVNKRLAAKMFAEYMYEDMIQPEQEEKEGKLLFKLPVSETKFYRFTGYQRLFDSYDIQADSIEVHCGNGGGEKVSATELLLDLKPLIGMSAETCGHLIKEFQSTLLADVHLLAQAKTSDELTELPYEELEGEMTGHPWITYNKGRIGFDYEDYLKYAPEQKRETKLLWIAVRKTRARFQAVEGLNCSRLLEQELDEAVWQKFHQHLAEKGLESCQYFYMPVHEWQWNNVIIQQFAEDLAFNQIVFLGEGTDTYLPQQSIRTFSNTTDQRRHHVKLPMSILNTLVYRGLPAERTVIAPEITEHIKGIADRDPFLRDECRVILPGEIASINVDHSLYSRLEKAPYQYLEMLGTIWRESIYTYLEKDERAITLAALTYEDENGKPFIESLIQKSGLQPAQWLDQFYQTVMPPLLHYLYQYGTVFSPHGQNTILVLKDYAPHRLAVKDFVDDVNISDQPFPELAALSGELKKVLRSEPPEGLTQFIFTGLFVCHLRYVSNAMVKRELISEHEFWALLAKAIQDYQKKFPQLEERFRLFNFFTPALTKLCLNRNRMVDYGYADGEDRPHASEFGKVSNPLASFAEVSSS